MNCHDCEELLQRQLDGETLAEAELDHHLAQCSKCRSLFAAGQLLLSGLRRMPAPTPPAALTRQIVSRVVQDQFRYRRLRWVVGTAMVAACLLFVVAVYYSLPPEDTSGAAQQMAQVSDTKADKVSDTKADKVTDTKSDKVADAKMDKGGTRKVKPMMKGIPQKRPTALDPLTAEMVDRSRKEIDERSDATVVVGPLRLDQSRDIAEIRMARQRSGMALALQTVAATTRRGLDFMLRETPQVPGDRNNEE